MKYKPTRVKSKILPNISGNLHVKEHCGMNYDVMSEATLQPQICQSL